jgi:hypothetical protein
MTLTEEGETNQALTEISIVVNADALSANGQITSNRNSAK